MKRKNICEKLDKLVFTVSGTLFVAFVIWCYQIDKENDLKMAGEFKETASLAIKGMSECKNPSVIFYDDKFGYDTTVECEANRSGSRILVHEIIHRGDVSIQVLVRNKDGKDHRRSSSNFST